MGMKHLRRGLEEHKSYRAETKGENPQQSIQIRKALRDKAQNKNKEDNKDKDS